MKRAFVVIVAVIAGLVPLPPRAVERAYSNGFYLALQPHVTGLSNRFGIALSDVLLIVVALIIVALVVSCVARRRRGWLRSIGGLALSIAALCGAVYLWFLVFWGANYRREPLAGRIAYDAARVSPASVQAVARSAAIIANRLHDPAHADGWSSPGVIDPVLAAAFADTQRLLGAPTLAAPARPKLTILEPYFRRTGVAGMTDPFFLETLVDDTLLPFERPLVVAHEWAHLAGFADEGEANFVGWLACVRARPPEQYSGWLFLYGELVESVPAADRRAVASTLAPGVRADLIAVNDRLRRNINPTLAMAGWRAYDQYLRANRVAEGTASYDTVVRLVTGTAFDAGWVPRLR